MHGAPNLDRLKGLVAKAAASQKAWYAAVDRIRESGPTTEANVGAHRVTLAEVDAEHQKYRDAVDLVFFEARSALLDEADDA